MAVSTADLEIIYNKRRRLDELLKQEAKLGYDTPPHIKNEIKDIRDELGGAAAASVETVAESHTILFGLLMETRADVRRLYYLLPICMLIFCGLLILLVKL